MHSGRHLYHQLTEAQLTSVHTLSDLPRTATRELTAEDYVYQIKRLAFPRFHCPIAGVMGGLYPGFR